MDEKEESLIRPERREAVVELLRKVSPKVVDKGGREINVACPFAPYTSDHKHAVDRKPSMGVRLRTGEPTLIHCYTCKWSSGNAGKGLAALILQLSNHDPSIRPLVVEAKRLEEIDEDDLSYLLASLSPDPVVQSRNAVFVDEVDYAPYRRIYHRYLEHRGVTLETAKRWDLGFDRGRRRVVFPVRDEWGQLKAIVGRAVDPGVVPKYLVYENEHGRVHRSRTLFGAHLADPGLPCVLVEGELDAVIADQGLREAGVSANVFATGSSPSEDQMSAVCRLSTYVATCYDNDPTGVLATNRALTLLRGRTQAGVVPYGWDGYHTGFHDPGDAKSMIAEMIRHTIPVY